MEDGDCRQLFEALAGSRICQEYCGAFSAATNVPITLRPVESWQLPFHGVPNENPFCAFMAETGRACAVCLQIQQRLCQRARQRPATVTCWNGLAVSAVPVHLGDHVIGFLETGQVFRAQPTDPQFQHSARLMTEWGVTADVEALKRAYFQGTVLSPLRYQALVELLSVFAAHLSLVAGQMAVQQENAEPLLIRRAKEFIRERHTDKLRLGQVARAANSSPFYFCKLFKKVTGVNFTYYVGCVRVEKAKNLLLNPDVHVSEIAYAVGFQSLTHFNRVFKALAGQTPTQYRACIAGKRKAELLEPPNGRGLPAAQ